MPLSVPFLKILMIQTKYFSLAQRRYFLAFLYYIFLDFHYIYLCKEGITFEVLLHLFCYHNFSTVSLFFWFMQSIDIECWVYKLILWNFFDLCKNLSWIVLKISFILLFSLESSCILLLLFLEKMEKYPGKSWKVLEFGRKNRVVTMVQITLKTVLVLLTAKCSLRIFNIKEYLLKETFTIRNRITSISSNDKLWKEVPLCRGCSYTP